MLLFSGNANQTLAQKVAVELGIPLSKAVVKQFSDKETHIEVLESVRGEDVFILQSTSKPANHHLMELLLLCDAIYRASARRITAVMPYFGYARQDKRVNSARVPISAKMVADLLTTVGVNHMLTVDLHAEQIQGFFSIPVDNLYGSEVFLKDMAHLLNENPVMVSPDVGGVIRVRRLATHMHTELAIIDKRRPSPNHAEVMHVIGNVHDRVCVMVDDMIDTGDTLVQSAKALKEAGAKKIFAYSTHPVLSGDVIHAIQNAPIAELIVTDSIPLREDAASCLKIRQLSISSLLAKGMQHIHAETKNT